MLFSDFFWLVRLCVCAFVRRLESMFVAAREGKPLPLKMLLPLFTDLLITLTNAVWKRSLQFPEVTLRIQLDRVSHSCFSFANCFFSHI